MLYDPEYSWQVYKMLEAFSDGWGAWRFLPGQGSLLDQPWSLMEDLITWRWLANKVREQNKEQAKDNNG